MPTPTPLDDLGLLSTFAIDALADDFLASYRYGSSPHTFTTYRTHLRYLARWCGEQGVEDVHDLTARHVRAMLTERSVKAKPKTVRDTYHTVRQFLDWCVEEGALDANPAREKLVHAPRVPDSPVYAFDQEEARRLIKYAGNNPRRFEAARNQAIVVLLLGTGLRAAELCALDPRHIDFTNALVSVEHGKGGRARRVPLGQKAARALRKYLYERDRLVREKRRRAPDVLWLTNRLTPMNTVALRAMLKAVGEHAGVENVHPHRFRHTAATEHARMHGHPIKTQHFLGHRRIEQTMGYLQKLGVDWALEERLATPDEWLVS